MTDSTPQQLQLEPSPVKLCECGCGQPAPLASETSKRDGWIKGQPKRFVRGHNSRAVGLATRFWKHVDKRGPDECWEWQGSKDALGYGRLGLNHTPQLAHRVSWEIHNGPVPEGLCVLHNCPAGDNPSCVNPAHLWLGTKADNVADMDAKGRRVNAQRQGEMHPQAKLTEAQVREIRQRRADGEQSKTLAAEYGMNLHHINAIARRRIWKRI